MHQISVIIMQTPRYLQVRCDALAQRTPHTAAAARMWLQRLTRSWISQAASRRDLTAIPQRPAIFDNHFNCAPATRSSVRQNQFRGRFPSKAQLNHRVHY
jgi:hypothetical protein